MAKYLLLDIDDTIAPSMYRGSDAVEIETWGRGHLAIPKYIVDWIKLFSKKKTKAFGGVQIGQMRQLKLKNSYLLR